MLDDPLLPACFSTPDFQELRWIAADALNFWGGPIRGFLSSSGKCVPIARGAGADQPGFAFIADRLRAGDWVHIFPEGGRTRDPNGLLRTPFKNGIGRMILDTKPIAIPYYHYGMHQVMPIGAYLPRFGHQVHLKFGTPTNCNDAFIQSLSEGSDTRSLQRAIAHWSYLQLRALEMEVNPHAKSLT
jgi:monolysocardiolipin acyltransferase